MGIEEAFVTILEADAGVNALVGTGDDSRIFPNEIPQRMPMPAILYTLVNLETDHAMGVDTGLVNASYQFSCYDEGDDKYDGAKALVAVVKTALSRFKGTSAGVVIQDVLHDGETDLFDSTLERDGRAVDFIFWFEE